MAIFIYWLWISWVCGQTCSEVLTSTDVYNFSEVSISDDRLMNALRGTKYINADVTITAFADCTLETEPICVDHPRTCTADNLRYPTISSSCYRMYNKPGVRSLAWRRDDIVHAEYCPINVDYNLIECGAPLEPVLLARHLICSKRVEYSYRLALSRDVHYRPSPAWTTRLLTHNWMWARTTGNEHIYREGGILQAQLSQVEEASKCSEFELSLEDYDILMEVENVVPIRNGVFGRIVHYVSDLGKANITSPYQWLSPCGELIWLPENKGRGLGGVRSKGFHWYDSSQRGVYAISCVAHKQEFSPEPIRIPLVQESTVNLDTRSLCIAPLS